MALEAGKSEPEEGEVEQGEDGGGDDGAGVGAEEVVDEFGGTAPHQGQGDHPEDHGDGHQGEVRVMAASCTILARMEVMEPRVTTKTIMRALRTSPETMVRIG